MSVVYNKLIQTKKELVIAALQNTPLSVSEISKKLKCLPYNPY